MGKELPEPDESNAVVEWESEIVTELHEDGMFEEMTTMAASEFVGHMNDLSKMKEQTKEEWEQWPPWKVAHSVKGLCLSLGFARLAKYAKAVESLKVDIEPDDIPEIIKVMQNLFDEAMAEVKSKTNEP
uniref:HPt domain-containing protein n=1 Tax=Aureoumbra lagunensis TaxID=44058 RepID=A0A7S3K4T4_9STRA|mmetsp:Transcript_8800/g.12253  ORF Transcript_8800/g.12253 Transcript_8800/m.12253 type:complete len:129 (+) Transcript_8800:226-612(+)|eukprot:CAMPEP_0197290582 /NCGR_PEP_ID=MMETSP0890-20130614/8082_1 /TAXON_ID=44058 ORGANISM="Aureoumbra lagunensis, Strain CCMP1510" /NCGR_SAMPLE_ID=MMETSP0890 /ASSEMBLY_ACC=CAM_ASM_000533 /LENGTH=128 /DNA_ID=CAMNT_0042762643 /DNA_START=223 /DNA_END=609 /DNA_ORIENTATION=+